MSYVLCLKEAFQLSSKIIRKYEEYICAQFHMFLCNSAPTLSIKIYFIVAQRIFAWREAYFLSHYAVFKKDSQKAFWLDSDKELLYKTTSTSDSEMELNMRGQPVSWFSLR